MSESYSLKNHIEAILFWKGDPISISGLSKITGASKEEISIATEELRNDLKSRGIILIEHDNEFTLGTNPESSRLIETVRTEELSKDLGKAGLETLSIILYQGPIKRSEIDYIRGVNSNFILRNLLIRGLIERKVESREGQDSRAPVYSPSIELLKFLGISKVSELDDYENVRQSIKDFKSGDDEENIGGDSQVQNS